MPGGFPAAGNFVSGYLSCAPPLSTVYAGFINQVLHGLGKWTIVVSLGVFAAIPDADTTPAFSIRSESGFKIHQNLD